MPGRKLKICALPGLQTALAISSWRSKCRLGRSCF